MNTLLNARPWTSLAASPDYVDSLVRFLATLAHAFTLDDICVAGDTDMRMSDLRDALLSDDRFLCVSKCSDGNINLIPRLSLDRWFAWLNVRLASAGVFELSRQRLTRVACSLREHGRWETLEAGFTESPRRLGLISPSMTGDDFVFPLAWVLSSLTRTDLARAASIMRAMVERAYRTKCLESEDLRSILTRFPDRVAFVVQHREGLLDGERKTLEDISRRVGVTRERVRQIESRFWKQLRGMSRKHDYRMEFLRLFIAEYMETGGELIIQRLSQRAKTTRFTCKAVGVPVCERTESGHIIVGARFISVLPTARSGSALGTDAESLDVAIRDEAIAREIREEWGLYLRREDTMTLAHTVSARRKRALTKGEKVAVTLRRIGQPSHYSEIAEAFNAIWPDDVSTEHSIHAVLSRETHGVVWIGVRGTFALREWGYERPDKTLFESVEEIVNLKYRETESPVPFDVVRAEIGRYRRIVNPSSLYMAAFLNPNLTYIGQTLLPKRVHTGTMQNGHPSDKKLDEILGQFERTLDARLAKGSRKTCGTY